MIEIEGLTVGNIMLDKENRICRVEEIFKSEFRAPAIRGGLTTLPNKPLELTKEILKNNLGFEVSDMGDFWQAQKEDFVIVQIKFNFGNVQMPWVFMINSSIKGSVKFNHVHHLQNTFYDLKGKKLTWKN